MSRAIIGRPRCSVPPINAAERARRLGNVARILIELARRAKAAEGGGENVGAAVEFDESPEREAQ